MIIQTLFPYVWQTFNVEKSSLTNFDIFQAIDRILEYYKNSNLGLVNIPYSQRDFRCAYIYLYFTSHIRLVQEILTETFSKNHQHFMSWFRSILSKNEMNVCSVGGGPGSDIFGLILFLSSINHGSIKINATVLDMYVEWNSIANYFMSLLGKMSGNRNIKNQIIYRRFDYFQDLDANSMAAVKNADLVTMVKFVSAVIGNRVKEINNIKKILNCMKPDSLVFFVDNSGGGFRQAFTRAVEFSGFYNVETQIVKQFVIKDDERREMRIHQLARFPQCTTKISISLWRKRTNSRESSFQAPYQVLQNVNPYQFYPDFNNARMEVRNEVVNNNPISESRSQNFITSRINHQNINANSLVQRNVSHYSVANTFSELYFQDGISVCPPNPQKSSSSTNQHAKPTLHTRSSQSSSRMKKPETQYCKSNVTASNMQQRYHSAKEENIKEPEDSLCCCNIL